MNVLSEDGPTPETYATIVGKMEPEGNIPITVAFENRRGETLGLDTVIILQIGGQYGESKQMSIRQLSQIFPYLSDGWDIGEKIYPALIFPEELGDLTNVTINATVVDKVSNSIVFWGTLKGGYVVPPSGRGGIWHFDEPMWKNVTGEVKDSSGNNNHGTARNGANTTGESAISGRAGFFDEVDDYVDIPSSYSLDITQAITVEAYIKPLAGTRVLKWGEYDTQFYLRPNIIVISQFDEINYTCAVVGEEQGRDAVLSTVKINTHNGTITPISINNIFGSAPTGEQGQLWPKIVHVTGDLYAIVYKNSDRKIAVKTVYISAKGIVTPTNKPELSYDTGAEPDIIYVAPYPGEDAYVFAIAYQNRVGYVGTVKITTEGIVTPITYPAYPFDTDTNCGKPKIINVSGPVGDDYIYAIAYQKEAGYVKTVKIKSNGEVTDSFKPAFPFDTKCDESDIVYVSGPIDNVYIYAIAYSYDATGYVKTVKIKDDGEVTDTKMPKFPFAKAGYTPDIIHSLNDIYVVAYTNDKDIGYFKTISINSNGFVVDTGDQAVTFSRGPPNKFGKTPDIIHITHAVFAVAYEDQSAKPGTIATLRIYKDPTPPYKRGIVKFGAAQLYANDTIVYASINGPNQNLTLPINGEQWNHVVLTYDRSVFRLYCNYNKDTSNILGINRIEMPYSQPIAINPNKLMFGYRFYGYLDEIAIYDYVITI
jgi:hypothetical protein